MVNYRFWQNLANCERNDLTVAAHKAIYNGKIAFSLGQTFNDGDKPSQAEQYFTDGINLMADLFERHPEVADHDAYIEEGLLAVMYMIKIRQNNGEAEYKEHRLIPLMLKESGRIPDAQREWVMEQRTGFDVPVSEEE
jgi:hypothetical protein